VLLIGYADDTNIIGTIKGAVYDVHEQLKRELKKQGSTSESKKKSMVQKRIIIVK